MRRGLHFLLAFIFAGSFFILKNLQAANTDIVINEIGAYQASGHEWIEIWNKGNEPVDMLNWKFWENGTNHSISSSTCRGVQPCATTTIVQPNEYAVIAQDADQFLLDYPVFSAPVFDSSWGSLNEDGEEIGLKDETGNFVEQFTHIAAPNFSLERRDPFLADYTSNNWVEHLLENSVGLINTVFCRGEACLTSTTTDPSPTSTPDGTDAINRVSTDDLWPSIKINEIMSDPETGNEWVELYNTATSSLDVTGGMICDATSATSSCKTVTGTIAALSWLQVDLLSTRYLNNTGDTVSLKTPTGTFVDAITYGESAAAIPAKNQTLARKTDGVDLDSIIDWSITITPTPAAANVITAPPPPPSTSSGGGGGSSGSTANPPPIIINNIITTNTPTFFDTGSPSLILNELFPNPAGSDSTEEFIEIKNISLQTIDLTGWKIGDIQKNSPLTGSLATGKLLVVPRPQTGISLNNTTKEEVKLLNPAGAIVDKVSYDSAPQGQSYSRDEQKQWQWTEEVTKGEENIIELSAAGSATDKSIIWKITAPAVSAPNEVVEFDASNSADSRGGTLTFTWNFGNGQLVVGEKASHTFATSGTFTITVSASSTQGSIGEKEVNIDIRDGAFQTQGDVIISEILGNPTGTDTKEFIELLNNGLSTIDISGWKIKNKANRTFTIPLGVAIAPGSHLVFYKTVTGLSINNNGDKLTLLNATGETMDIVNIGKSAAGQSFALQNGEWHWTSEASPGKATAGVVLGEKIIAPTTQPKQTTTRVTTVRRTTTVVKPLLNLSIADARLQPKGTKIKITGIVTVLPGVFGTQYLYLTDGGAGIQIYSNKKVFPELSVGDVVAVTGDASSASGIPRINTKTIKDFDTLETAKTVAPQTITLEEISEDNLGNLIRVKGEVTAIKSNLMYIDDGHTEGAIYFKSGTGIDKKGFKEGEVVQIAGIVEQTKTGWQIWPRSKEDIVVVGISEDEQLKQAELQQSQTKETTQNYLSATAGGITTLIIAGLMKFRGSVAKEIIKKILVALLGIIKK